MTATLASVDHGVQSKRLSCLFETALGWMALEFDEQRLYRLLFGHKSLAQLLTAARQQKLELGEPNDALPTWISGLKTRLESFADGELQAFDEVPVAGDHLTPFASRVVEECRQLEWGQVVTYAQLAERAGRPGAARAVGNVMANNRLPIVVPCHRVVGSGGGLGGYSAPGGLTTKQRLLKAEGAL